jgi:3'(2'), 5'-bisphosphate nucleotidase
MNPEKLQGPELGEPSEMAKKMIVIAQQAGDLLMAHFRGELSVRYKNDDEFDPQTPADVASDALLRKSIGESFPDDLILSEEHPEIPSDYEKRIWMVDPLDGTKDFLKGNDSFSIQIGLWSKGKILFGLGYAPARKQLYLAEKGLGAYERQSDGTFRRIRVSNITDLKDARIITRNPGGENRPLDNAVEGLPAKEIIKDSCLKVCHVAAGEAEAHVNSNFRACKHDTCGVQLVLEEAGGVMTDLDGNPLDYRQPGTRWEKSYIAANNPEVLDQILKSIGSAKL